MSSRRLITRRPMAVPLLLLLALISQPIERRQSVASHGLLASLSLSLRLLPAVQAMRHKLVLHKHKSLIGPVGLPFGFLERGHYDLKVTNFAMVMTANASDELHRTPEAILAKTEPGFVLKRFKNEAAFTKFMDILQTNATICAFERSIDDGEEALGGRGDGEGDDEMPPLTWSDDFYPNTEEYGDDDNAMAAAAAAAALSQQQSNVDQGILLNPKVGRDTAVQHTFQAGQEGLYFLIYHVCPYDPYILSSFELEFHFGNKDKNNHETYLSSGERVLPLLYLYFAISYLLCLGIWYSNIRLIQSGGAGYFVERGVSPNMWRPVVYPIHQLMTVLLILKFLSIAFESLRFHAINLTGQAVVWSIFYYTISFVKGIFLFCVILLIGTGWSIVKPFLNDREKKTMLAVLILQVASNAAILALSTETEGQTSYHTWTFVLHAVDILCCCAVLIPIVWQVDQLEKNAGLDEIVEESGVGSSEGGVDRMERDALSNGNEKSDVLSKLKLFRTFYLLVIGYIYSTRILIYLFVSLLDFRHLWVRHFVVELITLAFYVSVGMLFRPVPEASSSYQRVALADGSREVELASAATHKNGTNRTTRV